VIEAPLPPGEAGRLSAVRALGLLETPADEAFDRITRVAAAAFDVPIATVTLIDQDRQWHKSCVGLPYREGPRAVSFCAHTILEEATLVVSDTELDPRFAGGPLVAGPPYIRFYAGHPVHAPTGERIGTLCIIDRRPRRLDGEQLQLLRDLAAWAEEELRRHAMSRALDRVHQSETFLRAITDGVAEGIVTFDEHGRILSANPAAEAAFRVTPGGLAGKGITTLVSDVVWDRAGADEMVDERQEMVGRRSDGETFPLELVISQAEIPDGRLFVAIGQDVTERKRVEAALRESERRFRTIFDRAGIGIALVELGGRVLEANAALAEMLGVTREELRRADRDLLAHPEDTDGDLALLRSLREGRADRYRREKRYRRRDGHDFWAQLTVTALPEPDGPPRLGIAMIEDITRRKDVERLKDEFVSVVSHELRTPLTSIRGSLGLVEAGVTGELPGEAAHMVSMAIANTDRLVRLINDMLDMERLQSGRSELSLAPVTAADLIAQAAQVIVAVAGEHEVELQAEAAAELVVWADTDRILQALTNLLGNAVKFSPPGGTVEIEAAADGRRAIFTVRDHGRGIPPDQLEAVFERFRQVDASDAREKGGTGLGLPISRAIVEQHGGRMWAVSAPGAGTEFRFTLPLAASALETRSGAVLVVEDDAGVGELLRRVLRTVDVRVVGSAEEALEAIDAAPPALVVLDLVLPGRDGFAVLERLRADPALERVPVVVYTALDLETADRDRLGDEETTTVLFKADTTPQDVGRVVAAELARADGARLEPAR
jgi:PAS domain S-box-containing protein